MMGSEIDTLVRRLDEAGAFGFRTLNEKATIAHEARDAISVLQDMVKAGEAREKELTRQRDTLAAALRRIIATMDHAELDWTDPHTRLAVILEANDTLLDAGLEENDGHTDITR